MKHRGVLATSCAAILLTSCALANTRTHIDRQAKVLKTDTLPVCLSSESNQISTDTLRLNQIPSKIKCGADQIELLTSHLKGKRIALLVNQTSISGNQKEHLLDVLLSEGIRIDKIFTPEHGFRGDADAGQKVGNSIDTKTKIPIVSLYGNHKKPTPSDLKGIDIVLFDMQDVGTRFYTYISTMHYAMEACAENKVKMIIADRPNPNDYIDGPVRENDCKSFVGVDPIPILHGMTVGELALMINGEKWLKNGIQCDLTIIPIIGWKHGQPYHIPIAPSPNLPNDTAIRLYPSICIFEATVMSVGRGTDAPFQILGYDNPAFGTYRFTPKAKKGAQNPKLKGKHCHGVDLRIPSKDLIKMGFQSPEEIKGLSLKPLIYFYNLSKQKNIQLVDRKRTFQILIGNKKLLNQIEQGLSEEQIKETWKKDLDQFKQKRKKYLLYKE